MTARRKITRSRKPYSRPLTADDVMPWVLNAIIVAGMVGVAWALSLSHGGY